jgi:DNA primase
MAENFDDFVERVREANPIEEVMQEQAFGGVALRGHGRLRTGAKHDSLNVRTDMQRVWWYSQNWNGDVFAWVMRQKGGTFMEALEVLARRAHLEMPRFAKEVNEGEVQRRRATADVFSVAAVVFQRWLVGTPLSPSTVTSPQMEEHNLGGDAEALGYARSRGWSDETLRAAGVGFSGRKTAEQVKDMCGEFSLYGIDPLSPAAVAVLGFEGDVGEWAGLQGLLDDPDFDREWLNKGRIHGLMDTPGLIYAHQWQGGVRYLSRRQLPGFDKIRDRETKRERAWKSFNPHKVLAGAKQPFWNHVHRMDKPLVCVEGQGDAVTFGQWGVGALAFCGLLGDPEQMAAEDGERMRKLVALIGKHPRVYVCLDMDEAGERALKLAAKWLGPKVQVLRMSQAMPREDGAEVDDAEA